MLVKNLSDEQEQRIIRQLIDKTLNNFNIEMQYQQ